MTVVGAGYIGVELGTAFAKLGVRVTLARGAGPILPHLDERLTRPVAERLEALGVEVRTNAEADDPSTDVVARRHRPPPNTDGLGLARADAIGPATGGSSRSAPRPPRDAPRSRRSATSSKAPRSPTARRPRPRSPSTRSPAARPTSTRCSSRRSSSPTPRSPPSASPRQQATRRRPRRARPHRPARRPPAARRRCTSPPASTTRRRRPRAPTASSASTSSARTRAS